MKGKINIESKISEQELIEACLNYYNSGYDPSLILSFHALANSWDWEKLMYYIRLIRRKDESRHLLQSLNR